MLAKYRMTLLLWTICFSMTLCGCTETMPLTNNAADVPPPAESRTPAETSTPTTESETPEETAFPQDTNAAQKENADSDTSHYYIGNQRTKKFHRPDCPAVEQINEENKISLHDAPDIIPEHGYRPCKRCNP